MEGCQQCTILKYHRLVTTSYSYNHQWTKRHLLPKVGFDGFHSFPNLTIIHRLGQECQPEGFPTEPPKEALFDTKKVVIVSNGRLVDFISRYHGLTKKFLQMCQFLLFVQC